MGDSARWQVAMIDWVAVRFHAELRALQLARIDETE
jgi:hypothetical protein